MKIFMRTAAALLAVLVFGLTTTASAQKEKTSLTPDEAKSQQAYALGIQAYIWGYPMVVMQMSRDAMTKGGDAPVTPKEFNKTGKLFAPVNQVQTPGACRDPSSRQFSRETAIPSIR